MYMVLYQRQVIHISHKICVYYFGVPPETDVGLIYAYTIVFEGACHQQKVVQNNQKISLCL